MRNELVLHINGRRHRVDASFAGWTLSSYLRDQLRQVGTKIVCSEGDCGACTVLVGRPAACRTSFHYQPIDSCIAFLYQLDGAHVVTVEGLGGAPELSSDLDSLTPIQQAMVDCHGSQCGYCTPGFVMTMHGMVEESSTAGLDEASMRLGLSGNLCRCTGYAQIIDAGQSVDATTLRRMNDVYPPASLLNDASKLDDGEPIRLESAERSFLIPATLDQAIAMRAEFPDARVVAGGTDVGVWFNHGKPDAAKIIYTGQLEELRTIQPSGQWFSIGASVTWTELIEAIESEHPAFLSFREILIRFGSPQIRNMGTVGGNLVNASPIADSIPGFLVHHARVRLASVRGCRVVPLHDFYLGYKQLDLSCDELLVSIELEVPSETTRVHLEKVSKRRDMDISTFTAAIALDFSDSRIDAARVALGGVGPVVLRTPKAEAFLVGQTLSESTMRAAGRIARQEIKPL
ncbi:MAG: FAD binding domain-containing protein, partial [Planctomycetota bacterium]